MAAKAKDQEDYWPSYVDALSSMVMTLAYVMILLALIIFFLSQNTSRSAVEGLAKAANVPVDAGTSVEEITVKLKEAIAAMGRGADSAERLSEADTNVRKPTVPVTPDRPVEIARTPKIELSPAMPESHLGVTLRYAGRTQVIGHNAKQELDAFLGRAAGIAPTGTFMIWAHAAEADISITEARRLAYYRAMLLRSELIARKVDAGSIEIRFFDTPDASRGTSVDIIFKP